MRNRILTSILLLASIGCNQLDTDYAASRGKSINGVQVFTDLIRSEGFQVDQWPALGEHLYYDYDLVIVFHDNFSAPDSESIEYLEELMSWSDATTFLFVGRDLDIAPRYWRTVSSQLSQGADPEQAERASQLATDALNKLKANLSTTYDLYLSNEFFGGTFFSVELPESENNIREISEIIVKHPEESKKQDEKSFPCQWELYRKLVPSPKANVLWQTSDKEPLLISQESDGTRLFALGSAYPLLNGALIDQGNQKLALELLRLLEPTGKIAVVSKNIVFDPNKEDSGLLRFLKVYPHPWIASHLLLFLGLFCLSRLVIFGRPRVEVYKDLKRFGAHVEALGDLMRRTRQTQFAKKRILEWKERRSAGRKPGAK